MIRGWSPAIPAVRMRRIPIPAEMSLIRSVVAELGLGRERVLSAEGRDEAAERWLAGEGGPDNPLSRLAPDVCETCGFFVRLQGSLGTLFGVCANAFSVSEGTVVSVDHGCGAHSNVLADERAMSFRRRSGTPSNGMHRSRSSTDRDGPRLQERRAGGLAVVRRLTGSGMRNFVGFFVSVTLVTNWLRSVDVSIRLVTLGDFS